MCFLVIAAELGAESSQWSHPDFVPAFARVIQLLNVTTVPQLLLQLFIPFIA
jgi:hypothetical protein